MKVTHRGEKLVTTREDHGEEIVANEMDIEEAELVLEGLQQPQPDLEGLEQPQPVLEGLEQPQPVLQSLQQHQPVLEDVQLMELDLTSVSENRLSEKTTFQRKHGKRQRRLQEFSRW